MTPVDRPSLQQRRAQQCEDRERQQCDQRDVHHGRDDQPRQADEHDAQYERARGQMRERGDRPHGRRQQEPGMLRGTDLFVIVLVQAEQGGDRGLGVITHRERGKSPGHDAV